MPHPVALPILLTSLHHGVPTALPSQSPRTGSWMPMDASLTHSRTPRWVVVCTPSLNTWKNTRGGRQPPSPTWTKLHGVALQDQLCVILLQLSEDVLLNMYKKMVTVCDMDEQLSKAHKMVSPATECHQLSVV